HDHRHARDQLAVAHRGRPVRRLAELFQLRPIVEGPAGAAPVAPAERTGPAAMGERPLHPPRLAIRSRRAPRRSPPLIPSCTAARVHAVASPPVPATFARIGSTSSSGTKRLRPSGPP